MSKVRKTLSLLPFLFLWALMSVLLWSFVFVRLTDTDPAHKVTLFINARVPDPTELSARLSLIVTQGPYVACVNEERTAEFPE